MITRATTPARTRRLSHEDRPGFALAAIVFSLMLVSLLAAATLESSSDGSLSARAYRESGMALYAAEAGLRQTIANWPSGVASMKPGDSLVVADSAKLANRSR